MGKTSTDALLNRRIQKLDQISSLRALVLSSEQKIEKLTEEVDKLEDDALQNMRGVISISFKD